ncbi:MAG: hypothetical protein Q9217_006726, partial [Psora testacea]
MPHATSPCNDQGAQDDALIQQALDPESQLDFSRDLEPGEKADDAVDFGDLSDDDLADDEDVSGERVGQGIPSPTVRRDNALTEDLACFDSSIAREAFDDLFGEDAPSSPEGGDLTTKAMQSVDETFRDSYDASESQMHAQALDSTAFAHSLQVISSQTFSRFTNSGVKNASLSKEQQLQQELFSLSRSGLATAENLPEPPENHEELLAALWPKFERDATPRFMDLLPPKKARYMAKQIPKPPKPVNLTKISLELAQDQEKSFRVSLSYGKRKHETMEIPGAVSIRSDSQTDESSDEDVDMDADHESNGVHGVSWQDFQILCEDWATLSSAGSDAPDAFQSAGEQTFAKTAVDDLEADAEHEICEALAEKQQLGNTTLEILRHQSVFLPPPNDPELATTHIAKKIRLDLNDPHLLVDDSHANAAKPSVQGRFQCKYPHQGAAAKGLSQRYNISNDDAYDLLKENHQNKIRTFANFRKYKTRLEKQESRSFHRPPLRVNRHEQIAFNKPHFVKRKYVKGKDTHTLFAESKDLSLGDNSNVLLLEYSEEYPTMLSNLGMGNKVINYYRKKSAEDNSRPKMDIGELSILLPQDKSPFSLFGHIDLGQVTTAIYNGMYRAPIFKQEPKSTDFLVVRSTTGINGSSWFLRTIDNLHVVGQEFPAVDVPGPHSRKVTTASKNRLRMISYRLARRNKSHRISVSEVTNHFIDTTDMQNRQKMKEFMQFDKDHKEWKMRPGESIPDEETVRTMVKPEDVCLLESMQVGQQHLQDAGFSKDDDDASEGDEAKEGQSVEQRLAPWFTSRNFLNAAQGKAMLQLHGAGDPSRRGEAFSFIKTSMKGGFRAIGESIAERIDNKKMKDSGGHSYNVARQQQAYEESIRRIWDAQKHSLSSKVEQSDTDMDEDELVETLDANDGVGTPRSEARMSGTKSRRDDEAASQSTKWSANSQTGKILEITRTVRDRYGNEEAVRDVIRNPRVIRQYLRRRRAQEAANEDLLDIKPGMDEEENKRKAQRLKKELERLNRNKDRRIARDKQKGIHTDGATEGEGSPTSPGAVATKTAGTQRKCANCGQVGHIKTNK